MSIELSSDQRHAVDTEGTPLKIVDPRTGSTYVLVPEAAFRVTRSSPYQKDVSGTPRDEWSDVKNQRRCDLIDKEIDGTITDTEVAELNVLQQEMLKYRRKVAPLPLDDLRSLHQQLMNYASDKRG